MKFASFISTTLAAATLAVAIPVDEATSPPQANVVFLAKYCSLPNFKGSCQYESYGLNQCTGVGLDYNDRIQSFAAPLPFECQLFQNIGCTGYAITLPRGTSNDLSAFPQTTSYKCTGPYDN